MILDQTERTRLLAQLQRQLRERLAPRLQALFDELDARLFDLAERSRIGTQQHAFYDGLRECRRMRTDIEREFLDGATASLRPSGARLSDGSHPLSLLADEELEESLALDVVADRTAQRLAVPLQALERRIAALLDTTYSPEDAPRLAPQRLGMAFRAACQRLETGIEVRLVAYTLFGHHVFDALEGIYADLNRSLIAAGVLPALTLPPREPAAKPAERARDAEAQQARAHGDERNLMHALLGELRNLTQQARHTQSVAPLRAPTGATNEALSTQRLVDALDRLSRYSGDPRALKDELLAVSRTHARAPVALQPEDEDTVDLVGLLFEGFGRDQNLAHALQPLIARLQVPFLKAALHDPDLMVAGEHPARRLIDEIGDLALGWSMSSDAEGQLLARVEQIVDTLTTQPAEGRAPFDRAIAELRGQLEVGRHRAELAEQRAVEAALGRERLRIARTRVAATLERRLTRHPSLPWIRQLLRGPWANYLVLLWLRQGETGQGYRHALAFVDELLWCDEYGASGDEERLRTAEETLEDELRHGLSTVAYHDREIERLVSELREFIGALRRRASPPAFAFEVDPKLGTSDFSLSWHELPQEDQPSPERVDTDLLARLRSVPPGTWFEFGARNGERAKLSWTSPFSGRCLFVNRNGLRVDEITPERLADEIERGITRILEGTRLLQRVLQTLLTQLRGDERETA